MIRYSNNRAEISSVAEEAVNCLSRIRTPCWGKGKVLEGEDGMVFTIFDDLRSFHIRVPWRGIIPVNYN